MALFPVIMAGGSGTRFWPLSRTARPKQFLPLASSRPLLVDTAARVRGLARPANTFVVCGPAHAKQVKKHLPSLQVVVEPVARNTAPAIGLACLHVAARDPRGIVAVLPSDHHIRDVPAFRAVLAEAAEVAHGGQIVTVGIRPDRPDTGFGYLRVGPRLPGAASAARVAAFVEKPDLATAKQYLAAGDYLWNGGIFVFRADVMLQAFGEHMPDLHRGLQKIGAALGKKTYAGVLRQQFARLPAISIDYGVAEKASNIAVVPGDFGWSDVGSFAAIPEVRTPDAKGNVVTGKATFAIDCTDSVLLGGDRVLAVVGMQGVVVVDAGDALLVLPKERSQDVRQVVDALKARKLDRVL
jgi:mannose-1-phosphate guanylyltransferase